MLAADTDRAGPCPAGSAPACTLIGAMQSHSIVRQLSVAHKGQSRVACNAECQAFLGTMALPGGAQPTQIELGLAPPVAPLHAPWSGRCRVTASSANSVLHTRVRAASRATQDPSSVLGDHGTLSRGAQPTQIELGLAPLQSPDQGACRDATGGARPSSICVGCAPPGSAMVPKNA